VCVCVFYCRDFDLNSLSAQNYLNLQLLPEIDDVTDDVFETPLLHGDGRRRMSLVLSADSQYVSFASSQCTISPANSVQNYTRGSSGARLDSDEDFRITD
jgi:hypothetical protein